MKYAIYDKAANGYLTEMDFDIVLSNDTKFRCALTEYITNAKLLDTKEAAIDVVTRIEGFKFMDKGRFVIHSFDDTLKDQYIISEAGTPTKVVDNITVDLDGTVNVKYGTILTHWSTASLEYAINRMNALQKAVSAIYTSWNNTFMIYKVITIIDENEHTHNQFVNVTITGITKYEKEEEKLLAVGNEIINTTSLLNKRTEELKKANYELGEQVAERGAVANRLLDENKILKNTIDAIYTDLKSADVYNNLKYTLGSLDHNTDLDNISMTTKLGYIINKGHCVTAKDEIYSIVENIISIYKANDDLKNKVESIKKEAHDWKNLYKNADRERDVLKNVIDNIYDALHSDDMREDLKDTYDYVHNFSELHNIKIHNDNDDTGMPIYITANVEFRCIIDKIIAIIESRELSKKTVYAAEEIPKAIANDIIDICEANAKFEITLKKFSELYVAVNALYNTNDDTILHAFKSILFIFSTMDHELENFAAEIVKWKNENRKLRITRDCTASIIRAIRNAITDSNTDAFDCIVSSMIHDSDFNSDPFMAGVRENAKDICTAEKRNIANHDLKNSENTRLTKERDKALEQKEFYKRQANSVYGFAMPIRCCGKQVTADILSGKKIPVDKKKYDNLVEYVANINLTYDNMFCMMDKPVYLSTITESLNELTK